MGAACRFSDLFAVRLENQRVNPASLFRRKLHRPGSRTSLHASVGLPRVHQPPWPGHPTRSGGCPVGLQRCSPREGGLLARVLPVPRRLGGATHLTSSPCCMNGGFFLLPCGAAGATLGREGERAPGGGGRRGRPSPLPAAAAEAVAELWMWLPRVSCSATRIN